MNRDQIKELTLRSGFTYEKTVKSYPSRRGDEDIYTRRPEYRYTFRVSRVDAESLQYGLNVGIGEQFRQINAIEPHDIDAAEAWDSDRPLPMWTGENLKKLLGALHQVNTKRDSWNDDEVLITTILPTIST